MNRQKQERISEIYDAIENLSDSRTAAEIFNSCKRDAEEYGADLEHLLKAEFKIIHRRHLDGLNFTNHVINIIREGAEVFPRFGES